MAKKLGAKLVNAHAQHKDAPPDVGNARLPDGIEDGIAQLRDIKIGEYKEGDHKGQLFFMAQAVLVEPKEHNGRSVAGMRTTAGPVPLCDTPKSKGKKKTFADHYAVFLNHLKLLGVETEKNAAGTPDEVEAFLMASIDILKKQQPYFTIRTWKGKPTTEFPNPRVNEEWGPVCEYSPSDDPSAGMTDSDGGPPMNPTEPFTEPPQSPPPATPTASAPSPEDEVQALVEVCLGDPNSKTPEGADAAARLAELALAAGFTEKQITDCPSWADVGALALGIAPDAPPEEAKPAAPAKGAKYKFQRRDSRGAPLVNVKDKKPFPAIEVEVLTVDDAAKTVTCKGADGKTVSGLDKKPTVIKWEWLE